MGKPRTLNCGQSAQIHPLGSFAHLFDCWDFNVGISDCEVSGWSLATTPSPDALLREEIIPAWLRFTWTFNYFKFAVFFFFLLLLLLVTASLINLTALIDPAPTAIVVKRLFYSNKDRNYVLKSSSVVN